MKILISQRIGKDKYNEYYDYLENKYIDFFNRYKLTPILLPNTIDEVENFFYSNECSKIILTGGEDINPFYYIKNTKKRNKYHYIRDKNEYLLIKLAVKKKIPLLGLCRGFQLINVFFDGKLSNNIKLKLKQSSKKHQLKIINKLKNLKIGKKYFVNSYHTQGVFIKDLSIKLTPIATTVDNKLIECFKHNNLPILGIQWHLERKSYSEDLDNLLFNLFLSYK